MNKKEIIIFGCLLVFAIAAFLIIRFVDTGSQKSVLITVDGEEYKSVMLSNEHLSFTIYTDEGINEVVIEDGQVDVIHADCPTQICVNTKAASKINDMIVCLPHKVVIEVVEIEDKEK